MSRRWRWRGGNSAVSIALVIALAVGVFAFAGYVALRDPQPPAGAVTIEDVPTPKATTGPLRVAFIGDSYTAGAGSTPGRGGFVEDLAKREGWNVENLGIGGTGYVVYENQDAANAQKACARDYCPNYPEQIRAAAKFDPDVVIVSGGRNNTETPVGELAPAITEFYRQLRAAVGPDVDIWATSPLWDEDPAPAALGAISAEVRRAVTAVGGTYLGIGQPLRGHADMVAPDGEHPNDAGHAAIAEAIHAELPASRN